MIRVMRFYEPKDSWAPILWDSIGRCQRHAIGWPPQNPPMSNNITIGDHGWTKPRRMDDKRHPIEVIGRVRWIGSWED